MPRRFALLMLCGCLLVVSNLLAKEYTDPAQTDADFPFQGEYLGEIAKDDKTEKIGVQVIALGAGKFHAVGYHGGLPGAGWDQSEKIEADGVRTDDSVTFKTDHGTAIIKAGVLTLLTPDGKEIATLKKTTRTSPTLGAKPPRGAVVLFDGTSTDAWQNGKSENGLLLQGTTSKQTFGNHKMHIEFRTPYAPEARGQGRGNSGVYLQGRYEVQVLDSFGLTGEQNECGGIYSVGAPSVNMCLPPLEWQTYDIDFTAGQYDSAGKVIKNPRVTVTHNGVVIHKDIELPGGRNTTAAPNKAGPAPGPLYLQDHGNPVRYRNVWIEEVK